MAFNRLKEALQKVPGFVLVGDRRSGKTTALLNIIHEDYRGKAALIVGANHQADMFRCAYRNSFPGDSVPLVASIDNLDHLFGLSGVPVYSDEVRLSVHQRVRFDYRGGFIS